jgi:signal transduction histidine kinase
MNVNVLERRDANDLMNKQHRLDRSVARILQEDYPDLRLRRAVRESHLLQNVTLRSLASDPLSLDRFIEKFASMRSCGAVQVQRMRMVLVRELRNVELADQMTINKKSAVDFQSEGNSAGQDGPQGYICESTPLSIPVATFCIEMDPAAQSLLLAGSQAFLDMVELPDAQHSELFELFLRTVHSDDLLSLKDTLEGAVRDRSSVSWMGRLQVSSGLKQVCVTIQPLSNSSSEQKCYGALQDLTNVKDLQARFETVLDAAQAYTWRRDLSLRLSQFGHRWAKFAHHDDGKDSLRNDEWLALVHPDDSPRVSRQLEILERGEERHQTLVYRRKLADGSWVWLRVHAGVSEETADGTPLALSGVSFDITAEMEAHERSAVARRGLQNELDDASEVLERVAYELTEHIPVGTFTLVLKPNDEMARFGFVSGRFLEITGISEEDARSDLLSAFACVHPDDYDEWVQKNIYAFTHKTNFREEARFLVNGAVKWIVVEAIPRLRNDGAWIWEGVIQDISSQKLSERMLRAANRKMLETTRAQSQMDERERLLQDIHEGFGSQLAFGKLRLRQGDQSSVDAEDIIDECLDDLTLLVMSLDTQDNSLWRILNTIKERSKRRIRKSSCLLNWDIDPAQNIQLEPSMMLQVGRIVQECISNSLKHAEAQSVAITVRIVKGQHLIEIQDDGKGFDANQITAGHGLSNMRAKAKRQGWVFNIASDSFGTCVTLNLGVS